MTDLGTLGGTMGGTGVLSMIGIGTPEAILGASALNATIAWKNTTRNIEAQKERDQRLAELQERFRLEDKAFQVELERRRERMQLHRDETQREFTQNWPRPILLSLDRTHTSMALFSFNRRIHNVCRLNSSWNQR